MALTREGARGMESSSWSLHARHFRTCKKIGNRVLCLYDLNSATNILIGPKKPRTEISLHPTLNPLHTPSLKPSTRSLTPSPNLPPPSPTIVLTRLQLLLKNLSLRPACNPLPALVKYASISPINRPTLLPTGSLASVPCSAFSARIPCSSCPKRCVSGVGAVDCAEADEEPREVRARVVEDSDAVARRMESWWASMASWKRGQRSMFVALM